MRVILRLFLVLVVLAIIGAVAIWQCPASLAIPYLWKSTNVSLDDLSGTIWDGHAGKLSVRGQALGQVDWHLYAQPLLDKRRVADFTVAGDGVSARGHLEKFATDTDLRDLVFKAPAAIAAKFAHLDTVTATGDVEGTLAHLAVHDGAVTDLRADVQWHKAAISAPQAIDFGEAHLRFATTVPGSIAGDVQVTRDTMRFAGNFVTRESVADSDWQNISFHLPAQVLMLPLHLKDVTLSGDVDGSIPTLQLRGWLPTDIDGSLAWDNANVSGAMQAALGKVDATFKKATDGSITATVGSSNRAMSADGTFKVQQTQPTLSVDWHGVHFRFPVSLATPLIHVQNIQPSGDVEGAFTALEWREHWPTKLTEGKVTWRNAQIAGAANANLGDLGIDFSSVADGSIIGVMGDAGSGALKVDGTFKLAREDYDVEMILSARNGDAQVREALHHIGTLQPDGSSVLKNGGKTATLFK